jgi:hypothetical protein
MADITTFEAAELLGVPQATLVAWLDELPIPRTEDGVDEAGLEVLEAVRALKAFDHGDQTIRRHLQAEFAEVAALAPAPPVDPAPAVDLAPPVDLAPAPVLTAPTAEASEGDDFALDLLALVTAVSEAMLPLQQRIAELAEEKAQAHAAISREVGRLEGENTHLKADHARMACDLAAAREREARLEDLLAGTHLRIAALERAASIHWWNPFTWAR